MALTKNDLLARMRRLDELVRRLSMEETRFKDCDVTCDVQLHFTDRQEYRDALHEASRALTRARIVLAGVVSRD